MHLQTYVYLNIYIYTYIYVFKYTHTHMHVHMDPRHIPSQCGFVVSQVSHTSISLRPTDSVQLIMPKLQGFVACWENLKAAQLILPLSLRDVPW